MVSIISKLKYIRLNDAAKELDCSVDHIAHFAACGITRIGLPYSPNGFCLDHIVTSENGEFVKGFQFIEDGWIGFAFIDTAYLKDAEMNGLDYCVFTALNLDDGRSIAFTPSDDSTSWHRFVVEGVKFEKLYIRQEEFTQLRQYLNGKTEAADIKNKERVAMLKIIHALAKNGYKYPQHGAIKDILDDFQRHNNGVSEKTLKKYLDEFDTL